VACQTTWFQVTPLFDFEPAIKLDFVETLRSVKSMSQQELQDQLSKLPVDVKASDVHEANIVFMNQKHVAVEKITKGLTLIKSPKGSGKTHSLTSVIRDIYFRNFAITLDEFETEYDDEGPPTTWESGKTVLLVGHRQALIRSMCQRLDLNCYLDEKDRSPSLSRRDFRKRFGVCLDSIKKITSLESPIHRYDLVIIDEVEQVLAHLMASTSRDGAGFLDTLGRIVGNAESVIAMDADLGWTSFLTLNSMRNRSSNEGVKHRNEIYVNEYVAENRPIDIYESKPQLIAQLMSDAQSGKKVFVSTNSKTLVKRLEQVITTKLPDLKLIAITSENSSSEVVTKFVGDIKTEAKKYDLVISSPSLGTGIDITFSEDEEFYDSVYGIYEALINGHTEIDQQLARVRHPKSVKVWVSPRRFNFETHFDVIKADLLCSSVIANTALDLAMPVADQVFAENSDFFRTAALILSSQRESKNRLKKNFIEYKQSQGWIPNFVSAPDDEALGKEVLNLGKVLEEQDHAERLLNSKPLSESDFMRIDEAIDAKEDISLEERFSFWRMKLEIFYCQAIDLEMIKIDNRVNLRRQYSKYVKLTRPDKNASFLSKNIHITKERIEENLKVLFDDQALTLLLRRLLSSTPIFFENEVVTGVEFTSSDLRKFTRMCLRYKSVIERQFDINIRTDITGKPVRQLGDFLGVIGIKTLKPRTKKTPSGGKTYFYRIDPESVQRMTDLIALEEQRKNPWDAINARYGFNTTQNWG
jgi:hypothetical protein